MYLALKNALGKSFILFSGLLNKFSGATAAYSLRNLNNTYNGPIVKVRRAIDDEEEEFNSYEVNQIEDWVNGKQETTLPNQVSPSTASYSLRKVNPSYSGDAVRIRREADNVEVNVGFDSDDKVSTSSPITNVPEEFLSNDFNTWIPAGAVNVTSSSSFTASALGQGVQLSVPTGTKVKVTGAGTVTGAVVQLFDWSTGGNKQTLSGSFSFSTTFTIAGDQQRIYFRSAGATSINFTSLTIEVVNDDGGDTTATTLGAFLTEGGNQDATVHTWYDQSGNGKDATQDTSGSQPKIAEAGNIVTKLGKASIDFTPDVTFLENSSVSITETEVSYFAVWQVAADGSSGLEASNRTLFSMGGDGTFIATPNSADQMSWRRLATTNSFALAFSNLITPNLHSAIGTSSGANYYFNSSSIYSDSLTGSNTTRNNLRIGTKFFTENHRMTGYLSELLIYNSDESANRFKIESNINNYYGLSNVGLTGNWTADGNEEAFTADGQDGFTCQVATASVYVGQQLSEKLPSGNFINLSFDLDLQPLGGTAASINLILKKTTNWSSSSNTVSTATIVPVQGRNSVTLTSNDADAEYVVFAEGSDNVDFKVSNFKVSKFPFNDGFVHTWYDQSGNDNDATQSSIDLQPQIVTSGSLNTVNGKPSIKWDGVDDYMVASISGFKDIANLSSFHVVTPADAAAADTSTMTAFSFGIIGSGTNRGLSLASSTGAPGISGETITLSHESSGATTGRLASTSYSRAADTQSLLSLFNLSSGTTLFAQGSSVTLNLSNQINTSSDTSPSAVGFTSNNNVYLGGIFTTTPVDLEEESFQEIIFFDANKTSDRTSIESNIDDYYDII